MLAAHRHYYRSLKPALEAVRPAYIYERLCLGNYAGALLSQELGIPYIVEYNGSEISMRRSFDGTGYVYEDGIHPGRRAGVQAGDDDQRRVARR